MFPLRAHPGGLRCPARHTEGAIDLARLAGLNPAAVICEIIDEDGTMARLPSLKKFSETHRIPLIAIADLIAWCEVNGRMPSHPRRIYHRPSGKQRRPLLLSLTRRCQALSAGRI